MSSPHLTLSPPHNHISPLPLLVTLHSQCTMVAAKYLGLWGQISSWQLVSGCYSQQPFPHGRPKPSSQAFDTGHVTSNQCASVGDDSQGRTTPGQMRQRVAVVLDFRSSKQYDAKSGALPHVVVRPSDVELMLHKQGASF